MTDFTYNRIYINNGALATNEAIKDLTSGLLGIYTEDGTNATTANAGAAKFLQFAQGTADNKALLSDQIHKDYTIRARKVTGSTTSTQMEAEIEFSGDMYCDEQVVVNFRAYSNAIAATHPQGYNVSFVANTPCCDCDDDSCEAISAEDKEAVVAELLEKLQGDKFLKDFVGFEIDSGDNTIIVITGKEFSLYSGFDGSFRDLYIRDLVTFNAKAYRGATTSQDMILEEGKCEQMYEYEVTQEAEFPQGLPSQVRRVYKRYISNNLAEFRALPHNEDLVGEFEPTLTASVYDQIMIQAHVKTNPSWRDEVPQDFGIVIYTAPAQTAGIVAILAAFGITVDSY